MWTVTKVMDNSQEQLAPQVRPSQADGEIELQSGCGE